MVGWVSRRGRRHPPAGAFRWWVAHRSATPTHPTPFPPPLTTVVRSGVVGRALGRGLLRHLLGPRSALLGRGRGGCDAGLGLLEDLGRLFEVGDQEAEEVQPGALR